MRVVVTGASGRVGRWVVQELVEGRDDRVAHEVVAFGRHADPALPVSAWRLGDVEDLDALVEACAGADAVIHLAAYPKVGLATDQDTMRMNVMGTFNVHEAASRLGVGRVISTSSVAVLGFEHREREFLPDYLPMDESHPVRPQDPYGLSKEAAEAIARSFTAKRGMDTTVLRPPWVASPEQMAELAAKGGRPMERFGTFTYLDARDLAVAYRQALELPLHGHHVAFVVADDSTVATPLAELLPRLKPELAKRAEGIVGFGSTVTAAYAKQLLDWKPVRSWRDLPA